MITLVLLPGMDGTGNLFDPFVRAWGGTSQVQVVRYPTTEVLDYRALEDIVRKLLPVDGPYVLLGESFSGPLAISLAAQRPPNLLGVVLCCTFARNPRPSLAALRGLLGSLPLRPPLGLLEFFLLGRWAQPALRTLLAHALNTVTAEVMRARLGAVLEVDVVSSLRKLDLPILYLKATEDRLVPAQASHLALAHARGARLVEIAAPHGLLQAVPEQAAAAVREFMAAWVAGPACATNSVDSTCCQDRGERLRASWRRCWHALNGTGDGVALMQRVLAAWSEPQRKYHTLQHLQECLSLFERCTTAAEHPTEVEMAIWFHDAVYDVKGKDNEARSAAWARAELAQAGVLAEVIERVERLIMATCHAALPRGKDEQLLVDIDLAILGAARPRFLEYEEQVRAEYAWVPGFLFRRKRREILQAFLARQPIYHTPLIRDELEARARENLTYSMAELGR